MIEMSAGEWQHDADASSVTDTATQGDALLRLGIGDATEIEAGLPLHTLVRTRDLGSGKVARFSGAGDVFVGVRHGFAGDVGPVALQAFATLPTGTQGVGAGTWGAGVLMPAKFDLPGGFELDLTPEVDAAPDQDGNGRHLAFGNVTGLGHALGKAVKVEAELSAFRDRDPSGHTTPVLAALSLAWQVAPGFQLDVEADAGLNQDAPRRAFAVGFAKRLR